LICDWPEANQEICYDLPVTGQGPVRNCALLVREPLIKPFTNRRIIDSLRLAYDFSDLLFSSNATLHKILGLFEPLADYPRFSPVGFLRRFLQPPSVGVSVTVIPKFGPAPGIFNEGSHTSNFVSISIEIVVACHPFFLKITILSDSEQ
jgi:hypothetical protein